MPHARLVDRAWIVAGKKIAGHLDGKLARWPPFRADAQRQLAPRLLGKTGALDKAFLHYDKALAIDPKHLGAHEYLGEAYLMAGNLPKAEEHLKILDGLCFLPCDEYTKLKKVVAGYKATGKVGTSK